MAITSVSSNPYEALGLTNITTTSEDQEQGTLLMDDYLALMTTQLKNQDPLEPMDNGDFLAQIAQFATVSGIGDLNTSFSDFSTSMQSDQAIQGAALVGRSVLVASSIGMMTAEEGMQGQINVADPVNDLKVSIYSESGALVRTIDMGSASGYTNFSWDGIDENGEALTPGVYQFKATGTVQGNNAAFSTATVAKVDSVLVGGGSQGLILNLGGIGSVPFSEAQEIT